MMYNYVKSIVSYYFFCIVGYPKVTLYTLYKYPCDIWEYSFNNLSSE